MGFLELMKGEGWGDFDDHLSLSHFQPPLIPIRTPLHHIPYNLTPEKSHTPENHTPISSLWTTPNQDIPPNQQVKQVWLIAKKQKNPYFNVGCLSKDLLVGQSSGWDEMSQRMRTVPPPLPPYTLIHTHPPTLISIHPPSSPTLTHTLTLTPQPHPPNLIPTVYIQKQRKVSLWRRL